MNKTLIKNILLNILYALVSIFVIATITFFLFELIPGDVYNLDYIKNENVITNLKLKYGLDKPIIIRYFYMLKNLIILDFGNSFVSEGRSVWDIIASSFPYSCSIGITSILLAIVFGMIIGILLSKIKRNRCKSFFNYFMIIFIMCLFMY